MSVAGGVVVLLLLIPTFIIQDRMWRPYRAKGVYVRLVPTPKDTAMSSNVGSEPLLVRVDINRALDLNGAVMSREELRTELSEVLKRRADRTVFLWGHPELQFDDVASVMNLIHGTLGADVVILTPRAYAPTRSGEPLRDLR